MKKRELLTITRLIELCEEEIEDPRREGYNQQHKLVDILVIVLLAAISGCDDWLGVEDYGIAKEKWLRTFLELPNGMPSDDTYRRVFERIDPKQLERVYREWVMPYIGGCCGKQIAIDGKTICAASNAQENRRKSKIHIVSAWVREDGISLGQVRISEKSNEIRAIPELLDSLDIYGSTVTIDAMGCQTAIAEKIIAGKANYVLAVKNNQPTLYEEIKEYFDWAKTDSIERKSIDTYTSCSSEHDRIVRRSIAVTNEVQWYESKKDWKNLTSFICVTRHTERDGTVSEETQYYISSAGWSALRFAELIQGHWSIENSLHWSLDVVFHEDSSQIRKDHSPENLSIVRKIAKAMLQHEPSKLSIPRKMRRAAMIDEFAASVIGLK